MCVRFSFSCFFVSRSWVDKKIYDFGEKGKKYNNCKGLMFLWPGGVPVLAEGFFLDVVCTPLHAMSTSKVSRKQPRSIPGGLRQRYIDFESILIWTHKIKFVRCYFIFWLQKTIQTFLAQGLPLPLSLTFLPNCGQRKGMTPKHKFASLIFQHIYNYTTWYLCYICNVLFTQFCAQKTDIAFSGYRMRFIYKMWSIKYFINNLMQYMI